MEIKENTNIAGVSVFTGTNYRRPNGRIHIGYVADVADYSDGHVELKALISEMSAKDLSVRKEKNILRFSQRGNV